MIARRALVALVLALVTSAGLVFLPSLFPRRAYAIVVGWSFLAGGAHLLFFRASTLADAAVVGAVLALLLVVGSGSAAKSFGAAGTETRIELGAILRGLLFTSGSYVAGAALGHALRGARRPGGPPPPDA